MFFFSCDDSEVFLAEKKPSGQSIEEFRLFFWGCKRDKQLEELATFMPLW